ncbi:RNase P modulator RnpM [Haloplasma contractile]|uniref:Nucleic-acid-binding protein implicated in transcription termination n=1 Tax=Haloplasma contractile SSD-17B TaxID=1033810 RepID=U2DZ90_9MOLU|nr:YlxR family protein [Haloplasma contractile]ERJ13522.1 Nucleic-acid-binding protein implicated in transcription termination [Haloplasma contractile SSD-17B]
MTKQRKVPMRKCVVTGEQLPKGELVRVVKNKEGELFVDSTGKKNGRGAYLQLKKEVIDRAKKTNVLRKHLQVDIPEEIYESLYKLV